MTTCIVFVTGASRGFGRSFGVELARELASRGYSSTFVLISRDEAGLAGTVEGIRAVSPDCSVITQKASLDHLDALQPAFAAALESVRTLAAGTLFDVAVLVNNAGSLGPLVPVDRLAKSDGAGEALSALKSAIDLNVTSVIWLTSLFLAELDSGRLAVPRAHAAAAEASDSSAASAGLPPHAIVNVSSLCAVKPFSTNGVYCLGKAARDMLHAVVAGERSAAVDAPYPVRVIMYIRPSLVKVILAAFPRSLAPHSPTTIAI